MNEIDSDKAFELKKAAEANVSETLYEKLLGAIDGEDITVFTDAEAQALGLDNVENAISEVDALDAMTD